MSRILALCIAVMLVVSVTGCAADGADNDNDNNESSRFEATVLEVGDGYLLVEPEEGSPERLSSDKIEVSTVKIDPDGEPKVGDVVLIAYDGGILESYPARLAEVYGIEVVK